MKLKLVNVKRVYDVMDSDILMCVEKLCWDVDLVIEVLKLEVEKYRKEYIRDLEYDIFVLEMKLIEV